MPELRKVSGEKAVKILCNKLGFSICRKFLLFIDFVEISEHAQKPLHSISIRDSEIFSHRGF